MNEVAAWSHVHGNGSFQSEICDFFEGNKSSESNITRETCGPPGKKFVSRHGMDTVGPHDNIRGCRATVGKPKLHSIVALDEINATASDSTPGQCLKKQFQQIGAVDLIIPEAEFPLDGVSEWRSRNKPPVRPSTKFKEVGNNRHSLKGWSEVEPVENSRSVRRNLDTRADFCQVT